MSKRDKFDKAICTFKPCTTGFMQSFGIWFWLTFPPPDFGWGKSGNILRLVEIKHCIPDFTKSSIPDFFLLIDTVIPDNYLYILFAFLCHTICFARAVYNSQTKVLRLCYLPPFFYAHGPRRTFPNSKTSLRLKTFIPRKTALMKTRQH